LTSARARGVLCIDERALTNAQRAWARARSMVSDEAERQMRALLGELIEGQIRQMSVLVEMARQGDKKALLGWLKAYTGKRSTLVDRMQDVFRQGLRESAEAVRLTVMQEIGKDISDEALSRLISKYCTQSANNYARKTLEQITGLLEKYLQKGESGEQIAARLRARLERWRTERLGQVANDAAVGISGKITRAMADALGYDVIWVNAGGEVCPFCQELDGKTVDSNGDFRIEKGKIRTKKHPPLHNGCRCQLVLRKRGNQK